MSEALKELELIKDRYRKNKKLNKADKVLVENIIEKLLSNPSTVKEGLDAMLNIPSEQACKSYLSSISQLGTQERENFAGILVRSKLFESVAGCNRLLGLIKNCVPISEEVTVLFLAYLAEIVTASGSKRPSEKFSMSFRETIIESNILLQIPLAKYELPTKEVSVIAILLMNGLLVNISDKGDLIHKYAIWISTARNKPLLSTAITSEFEKQTSTLPLDLQRLLANYGLIRTTKTSVADLNVPDRSNNSTNENIISEQANFLHRKEQKSHIKAYDANKIDYERHLNTISSYIKELESMVNEFKKRITELESRLSRAITSRNSMEAKNKEMEVELKKVFEKNDLCSSEIEGLNNKINEIKLQHETNMAGKNEKIEGLLKQMQRERDFAKDELINNLTESLNFQYNEFCSIEERQMSEEIGEHLKHLLQKVFTVLKKNGCFADRG